jgi:hypothetical protein
LFFADDLGFGPALINLLFLLIFRVVLMMVLTVHSDQEIHQHLFKGFEVIEDLNSTATVQTGRLKKPYVAGVGVGGVVGGEVNGTGEDVHLFLDVRVLPGHVGLEFRDETEEGGGALAVAGVTLAGVIFVEEAEELLKVVLTVLVVEVDDEGDGGDAKNLHFFGFAVELQISDEVVFGGEFLIELKVVDCACLGEGCHFLVVVLVL